MRKIILCFILVMAFSVNSYGSELNIVSQGAILMDQKTGRVLWEKNSDQPLAMASTTKIMTAILVLEQGNLDDIVTISKNATYAPAVKMNLSAGEEITLRDLMYALMLQSYNDSAVAIAEHISGDVDTFCNLMTARAKELGAKDTVFRTPNGLDLDDHHSTAYDMAIITKHALDNEDFLEIINTPSRQVKTSKHTYSLQNKNRLLNELEGANGVKTGFTGKAGHCFVGAAKRGDMQLISVVFASGWGNQGKEQKWIDTKKILNYGFEKYSYQEIVSPMVLDEKVMVTKSRTENVGLYIDENLMLPLSAEELNSIRYETELVEAIEAPFEKDTVVGKLKVFMGDEKIKEINIKSDSGAQRHDFETSLKKIIKDWLNMGTNDIIELN